MKNGSLTDPPRRKKALTAGLGNYDRNLRSHVDDDGLAPLVQPIDHGLGREIMRGILGAAKRGR